VSSFLEGACCGAGGQRIRVRQQMVGGRSKFQRLGTGRMLAALVTLAVVCVVLPSTSAAAQEYQDPSFDCTADAGVVSWTDDAATKYWVYRSTDGGTSYQWIGRTIGSDGGPAPTSFADPRSAVGALYQVHYAGIPTASRNTGCTARPTTERRINGLVGPLGPMADRRRQRSPIPIRRSVPGTKFTTPEPHDSIA